jgi:hypothetical protein
MPERALRASDDDRDAVLRALERHTAVGRLNLDEFDQRSTAALVLLFVIAFVTLAVLVGMMLLHP